MRAMRFFSTCVISAAVAALSVSACSSDPEETEGEGGGGNTSTDTASGTTTPTNTNTNTNTGDGNDSFDEAEVLEPETEMQGSLEPVDEDVDYYVFQGTAGQAILVASMAKPDSDPFGEAYPDLVITLYDENQTQIAENDDPYIVRDSNNSEIYTVLPSTGAYYLRVQDCLTWENGGTEHCLPAEGITNFEYSVWVLPLDPAGDDVSEDAENGDDKASAVAMAYTERDPAGSGTYYASILYGTFNDNTDVDVFSMTIPSNLTVDSDQQEMLSITFAGPEGPDGSGTTNNPGMVWLEDDAGNRVAEIDHSLNGNDGARDIRVPVAVNEQFFLFVEHPGTTAGANDFYMALNHPGGSNPVEADEANNNVPATAEALDPQPGDYFYSFFVQGEMLTEADVDHFLVDASGATGFDPATWTVSYACGGQRSGSGLRSLHGEILGGGSPYDALANSSGTESASDDLAVQDIALGSGSTYILKLTSGAPAANVSSRVYQCGIHFGPPAN